MRTVPSTKALRRRRPAAAQPAGRLLHKSAFRIRLVGAAARLLAGAIFLDQATFSKIFFISSIVKARSVCVRTLPCFAMLPVAKNDLPIGAE